MTDHEERWLIRKIKNAQDIESVLFFEREYEEMKRYKELLAEREKQGIRLTKLTKTQLYKLYGITHEEAYAQGDTQDWWCAICGKDITAKPHIDHDHETNRFRGLLCSQCNLGLGLFRDSPELLERAIDYLLNSP